MDIKRSLQHLVIAIYIAATISGLAYALFRITIPGMPRPLKQWSYGMIAPYQTYRTFNEELVADGKVGDTWTRINLNQYLPFILGERSMRSYLVTFAVQNEEIRLKKYQLYADHVQRMEKSNGREWEEIRLMLENWPMSPGGHEYLRHEPFIETEFIIQIPIAK